MQAAAVVLFNMRCTSFSMTITAQKAAEILMTVNICINANDLSSHAFWHAHAMIIK
jgi:hypothetical protein